MHQQRVKRCQLVIYTSAAKPDPHHHRCSHTAKSLVEIGGLLFTHMVLPRNRHMGQCLWGGAVHIANHGIGHPPRRLRRHKATIHRNQFAADG